MWETKAPFGIYRRSIEALRGTVVRVTMVRVTMEGVLMGVMTWRS
jgi:hypothetical protein